MNTTLLRLAGPADLPAINDIYNHYVIHSTATFQTEPSTFAERQAWFAEHGDGYPVTVLEMAGDIIGWGSLSRFHPRAAYRPTVENSVYLRHDCLRRGLGTILLKDLIERAAQADVHSIVAVIAADQSASVGLHARHGFEQVALLKEVGRKFDRWLDVVYLQKMLPSRL